jgi:hypothetical protein
MLQLDHYLLAEQQEIITPRMSMRDQLLDQPPQLLNGVQPGRISGQGDELEPWVLRQRLSDRGMEMHGPIVDDQVDLLGVWLVLSGAQPTLSQPGSRHFAVLPRLHLTSHGIEKPHHPHERIASVTVGKLWLRSPHRSPQPSLAGLTIKTDFIAKEHYDLGGMVPRFLEGLLQAPLFPP